MKKIIYALLVFFMVNGTGCSKDDGGGSGGGSGGGGGGNTDQEQNLVIALNPDPGSSVVTALSASYAFQLLINSTPPKNGVKIDLTVTRESDNSVVSNQASQTTGATIKTVDLGIQNLQQGILYVVRVEVTSQTNAGNKATITFKVAKK